MLAARIAYRESQEAAKKKENKFMRVILWSIGHGGSAVAADMLAVRVSFSSMCGRKWRKRTKRFEERLSREGTAPHHLQSRAKASMPSRYNAVCILTPLHGQACAPRYL